jgi:precorrin-4/cobalt-precorrin-4 C11-methyltransferase
MGAAVSATGQVVFVGAGPGAADLITVRGARRIAEADLVLWPAGTVSIECIREHARPDAELVDSSRWGHEQLLATLRRAAAQRLTVAVVYNGELPTVGDLGRQLDVCRQLGMRVEVVAGVSVFAVAAAAVGRELTGEAPDDAVIATRTDCGLVRLPEWTRHAVPGRHGSTTAVVAPAARAGVLVEQLRASGYPDDTPVLIAYKISLPDQLVLRTTLGELECAVKNHRLWRQAVFLVGRALGTDQPRRNGGVGGIRQAGGFNQAGGAGQAGEAGQAGQPVRAKPYHPGRARRYRQADPPPDGWARRGGRTSLPPDQ